MYWIIEVKALIKNDRLFEHGVATLGLDINGRLRYSCGEYHNKATNDESIGIVLRKTSVVCPSEKQTDNQNVFLPYRTHLFNDMACYFVCADPMEFSQEPFVTDKLYPDCKQVSKGLMWVHQNKYRIMKPEQTDGESQHIVIQMKMNNIHISKDFIRDLEDLKTLIAVLGCTCDKKIKNQK